MSKAFVHCTNKNKQMQANERHVFAWVQYSTQIFTLMHALGVTLKAYKQLRENRTVIVR